MQRASVMYSKDGSTGYRKFYPSARAPAVNHERRAYLFGSFSHSEQAPVAALSTGRERLVTNAHFVILSNE